MGRIQGMSIENINVINQKAIEDGLMLPDGESLRGDFNQELGKDLSPREKLLYELLENSEIPADCETLYEKLYGSVGKKMQILRLVCWFLE